MGKRKCLCGTIKIIYVAIMFSGAVHGAEWVISKPVDVHLANPYFMSKPQSISAFVGKPKFVSIAKPKSASTVVDNLQYDSETVDKSKLVVLAHNAPINDIAAMPFIDNSPEFDKSIYKTSISGISSGDSLDFFDDRSSINQFKKWSVWVQPLFVSGFHAKTSTSMKFKTKTGSLSIGADTEMDNKTRIGFAFTFDRTGVTNSIGERTDMRTLLSSMYSRWDNRRYFLNTMVSLGQSHSTTKRTYSDSMFTGKFDSSILSMNMTAGKYYHFKGWKVLPSVSVNYSTVKFEDFTEKSNGLVTTMGKIPSFNALEVGFGFKLNRSYWGRSIVRYARYKPELSVTGFYDLESTGTGVKSRMPTGQNSFVLTVPKRDKFRFEGELGLTVSTYKRLKFKAGYLFSWSKSYRSHGVSAQVNYKF